MFLLGLGHTTICQSRIMALSPSAFSSFVFVFACFFGGGDHAHACTHAHARARARDLRLRRHYCSSLRAGNGSLFGLFGMSGAVVFPPTCGTDRQNTFLRTCLSLVTTGREKEMRKQNKKGPESWIHRAKGWGRMKSMSSSQAQEGGVMHDRKY
jgi:hypothetical protein